MKYIIVKGKTEDGRVEYQVSDGEPYNGKNSGKERSHSYDFTDLKEAGILCNKLNREMLGL